MRGLIIQPLALVYQPLELVPIAQFRLKASKKLAVVFEAYLPLLKKNNLHTTKEPTRMIPSRLSI
jgi:hypothetical protein